MSAAALIVKQGGDILSASECCDGVPNHGNYAKILQMRDTPQELLDMIEDPSFSMFDQWQVQVQAIIQLKAECRLFSKLDDDTVRKAKFTPMADLGRTLDELLAPLGPGATVAVLPYGPLDHPVREGGQPRPGLKGEAPARPWAQRFLPIPG